MGSAERGFHERFCGSLVDPPRRPKVVGSQARNRRRRQAKTLGVSVFKVGRSGAWTLRWQDPDSGKWKQRTLSQDESRTAGSRDGARRHKSVELEQRRTQLAAGATRKSDRSLAEALGAVIEAKVDERRQSTSAMHQDIADAFVAFMGARATVADVDVGRLVAFADERRKVKKQRAKRGGRRGEMTELNQPRAARTVAKELRHLQALLNRLRKRRELGLSVDDIADTLEKPTATHERKTYLADPASFWARCGSLPPVFRDFLRLTLLLGWRIGEGRALQWQDVDLSGDGLITIRGSNTKTGRGRTVPLVWTPSAKRILEAMKERSVGPWVFSVDGERPLGCVRKRLIAAGVPKGSSHVLRRTCATFSVNAPAIPIYVTAEKLGHGVEMLRKHYGGLLPFRIPGEVVSVEGAMGLRGS